MANWLTDARTLASPAIVILMVGNKTDLEEEREVTFLEASRLVLEVLQILSFSATTMEIICQTHFPLQICPREWFDVPGDFG